MYIPVFGKTTAFANFSSIAIAVSAVVSFYKRHVNRIILLTIEFSRFQAA